MDKFEHTFHPPYYPAQSTDEHGDIHWTVEDSKGDWLPVDFSYEEGALEYIQHLHNKPIEWRKT